EDSKNPYTDLAIAQALHMSRSDVTLLRKALSIGDSRERRKGVLVASMKEILMTDASISIRGMESALIEKGFNVSRNTLHKLMKELETSEILTEAIFQVTNDLEKSYHVKKDAFSVLVGASGSLKSQIELAKAAILYPQNGLHTLLHGPSGVGKSQLAECMYKFAVDSGTLNSEAPFTVFNCADYADNPQLLLSHLFGYAKGAFTGATEDKIGLVEKTNHGILFLDEIHRLPPEGQEIFFYLIDKGKYRRLGESDNQRSAEILLIAATTESLSSSLLKTFRRRIPVTIELPELDNRPLEERYEIIEQFFKQEALRMGDNLIVSQNVLKAFVLYEVIGNIGQLRSDIQVTCARSFLKHMGKSLGTVKIEIAEIPNDVVRGLMKINAFRYEINKIVKGDLEITGSKSNIIEAGDEKTCVLSKEIYKIIEDKYHAMKVQGVDEEIIGRVIENELETKIHNSVSSFKNKKQVSIKKDLEKIVGAPMIRVVEDMIEIAEGHYEYLDESLLYFLATHLVASRERINQNKPITNPRLEKIKIQYPKAFRIATEMAELASQSMSVVFPEDEIAFIAMYLKSCSETEAFFQESVGIIVMSHGRVASGMAAVANRLLGVNHAKSIEMSLDDSPEVALKLALELTRETENGKGVLFLVDMGSLAGVGEIVAKELSIKTRTIARVDTMMVIEAVRKAILPDANLDDIADGLQREPESTVNEHLFNSLDCWVISICLTGKGMAKVLEKKINDSFVDNPKIKVMTISAFEEKNLHDRIQELRKEKRIIATVGTIDPQVEEIPFISATKVLEEEGIDIIGKQYWLKTDKLLEDEVRENTFESGIFNKDTTLIKRSISTKEEVIDVMMQQLLQGGYVDAAYKASVIEREAMLPTVFKGGVALPHGDPHYVKNPVIGVVTLTEPISWGESHHVDCVFFIAISECRKDEFKKLYRIINNPYYLNKIKKCESFEELRELIRNV
ncbi:MAG: sigma 54-interacting transcriptional regulator, partial [Tissierellales bacterium]|nr:sigma 54-interacting transcriptional regulator [Tissierellales bacterium]